MAVLIIGFILILLALTMAYAEVDEKAKREQLLEKILEDEVKKRNLQ